MRAFAGSGGLGVVGREGGYSSVVLSEHFPIAGMGWGVCGQSENMNAECVGVGQAVPCSLSTGGWALSVTTASSRIWERMKGERNMTAGTPVNPTPLQIIFQGVGPDLQIIRTKEAGHDVAGPQKKVWE